MSAKISLLRQLLRESVTTRGSIITLQGSTAQIATSQGTATVTVPTGMTLRPGDAVTVQDKIILGRVRQQSDLRVYDL